MGKTIQDLAIGETGYTDIYAVVFDEHLCRWLSLDRTVVERPDADNTIPITRQNLTYDIDIRHGSGKCHGYRQHLKTMGEMVCLDELLPAAIKRDIAQVEKEWKSLPESYWQHAFCNK